MSADRGDDELRSLMTELKSRQKACVLPLLVSLVLTLQGFAQSLEPLRPLGWYGCIHCTAVFLFSLWQDVPELAASRERSLYRSQAYLVLSAVGFAACAGGRAVQVVQDDVLHILVLVVLLPVTAVWELVVADVADGFAFHAYLVVHFAVTCGYVRNEMWGHGWKICVISCILDILLALVLRGWHRQKEHITERSGGTGIMIQRLLTALCDGCCVVSGSGHIVIEDGRVLDLVGGAGVLGLGGASLVGEPFALLAAATDAKAAGKPPAEGFRIWNLKSGDGSLVKVEITSVRCIFPGHFAGAMFGRKASVAVPQNSYLYVMRQVHGGDPGAEKTRSEPHSGRLDSLRPRIPSLAGHSSRGQHAGGPDQSPDIKSNISGFSAGMRLEESGVERLRAGGLGAAPRPSSKSQVGVGSEVGRQSQVCGSRFSEVGRASQVSGFSNGSGMSARGATSAVTLANRRLQLMRKDRLGGMNFDRGTMILELDLPMSEVSSVVSDVHTANNTTGPSPITTNMRMLMTRSGASTADGDHHGEEIQTTEVRSIGPAKDGNVRVQLAFRSQLLSQHFARLENSEMEIKNMHRDLHVRNEVQEEQKSILKKFQKIVTRDFEGEACAAPQNVTVFVFEMRDDVRASVERLCDEMGFACRAFASISEGIIALQEESGIQSLGHGVDVPKTSSVHGRLRKPTWRAPCRTQLVLLGVSLLEQLRAEWRDAGIYVALFGAPDELEDIRNYLGASDEAALKDTLRTLGVCEHVQMPFGSETISSLSDSAMRHRFGGDFLLVHILGRGATGPVYGAKRLRDGEVVALKEISSTKIEQLERTRRNQVSASKAALAHDWKEIEIASGLKWPTVCELIDSWSAQGGKLVYIVMPVLVGGNLQDLIDKAAPSGAVIAKIEDICEWYAQTLHGISYLHWCGVVHRDIKTDNLLLDINKRSLRIADFGSAMVLPGPGPHPARRNCVRCDVTTVRITSPEVFTKRVFYAASDVWAIGATFYEVLSLKPLLSCDLPPDELLEIASAMDELPNRVRDVDTELGGDDAKNSRTLPTDLVISWAKLMRQAQPIPGLAQQLMELLCVSPSRRPSAAALCARARSARDLRRVLEAGVLSEPQKRMQHLADFDRLLAESNAAADLEPPEEAICAAAEGEAETAG